MTFRGPLMISLCAFSAIATTGCSGPSPFPPNAVIPGQPTNMPPSAIHLRLRPLQNPDVPSSPAQLETSFLWEPDAAAREWNTIVIHHTAANHGSVESIHEAHLKRKDSNGNHWLGIGYHFVIGNGDGMSDGEIEPTFRWREQMQGAHAGAGEYNEHGIGIALIGNFEEAAPTAAQVASVKRLVAALETRFGIPSDKVIGHSDIKATACPGKLFPLEEVRNAGQSSAQLLPGGAASGVRLVEGAGPRPVKRSALRPAGAPVLTPVEVPALRSVESERSLRP